MGIVYLAEDERLGRVVALKAVPGEATDTEAAVARLAREARLAAALNHPGIATIYALDVIDDRVYAASEYVEGPTLRAALAAGPFAPRRGLRLLRALADAVAAAHDRGIVHRDLKPENVVMTTGDRPKVLDFGIARWIDLDAGPDAAVTREHVLVGTPGYIAPERLRGQQVDARSDVFSLGVIGYELLTGRHPFTATDAAATLARVLEDVPPPFAGGLAVTASSDTDASLLAGLERIVFECLRKSPDERLRSAIVLVEELDALDTLDGDGAAARVTPAVPTAAPAGSQERARWWWRVHQGLAIVVHVALLVPLWGARDLASQDRGMGLFLAGVLAVTVAGALRMHLLFTARERPHELPNGHAASLTAIRIADVVYAVTLLVAGVLAMRAEAPAVLLVAAAASVAIASLVIDRATTRAAWGE